MLLGNTTFGNKTLTTFRTLRLSSLYVRVYMEGTCAISVLNRIPDGKGGRTLSCVMDWCTQAFNGLTAPLTCFLQGALAYICWVKAMTPFRRWALPKESLCLSL